MSIYNNIEKKEVLVESVSKQLSYVSVRELFGSLNENHNIYQNCIVSVAVTFENAVIDMRNSTITAETAVVAFTTTPANRY